MSTTALPIRHDGLMFQVGGHERIGTEELERALRPDDKWDDIGDEAREIDEEIFYYAPTGMIDSPNLGDYVAWMLD